MPLPSGTRLGPYEILTPLGAGGMGEVYKASDTRLDRTVAIKVLPADLAADVEFRARFDREAKTISQLNHPQICTLYDVGTDQSTAFLVLEYLEGETLAARLARGALPLPEALSIAIDIASALDAAHRHGIVHRDLKPGNVMILKASATRPGSARAKLLDFGLARSGPLNPHPGPTSDVLTVTGPLTAQGTLLGTFEYMAPEQIDGAQADARTDMFAFGAVLYEMLAGKRAFAGRTQASTLGAILKDHPPPISSTQPSVTPALEYIVRTCLEKDPELRFQSAHDLLLQLRWIAETGGVNAAASVAQRPVSRGRFGWVVAGVLAALAIGGWTLALIQSRDQPAPVEPVQLAITPAQNSTLAAPVQFAISPDGRQLVFLASSDGPPMLWVRSLAALDARALPGTERATFPFWSPDSRYIGFFAGRKLKKVPITGGSAVDVCDAVQGVGGTWNAQNVIVFAPTPNTSLSKVDASGGTPTPVTTLANGELNHRYPSFLPDGQHLIYLAQRGAARELRVASLASNETTALGATNSQGHYASGHVLFSRDGALMAQPFDLSTQEMSGDAFTVAEQVPSLDSGRAFFSASATGVLGYVRGPVRPITRLTWMDDTGNPLGMVGEPAAYSNLSLSPDEKRVAVSVTSTSGTSRDIWVIDLAKANKQRLTIDAFAADPTWSSDGSQVLYTSFRDGIFNRAFLRSADFGGQERPAVTMERLINAPDWSHDGRFLAFAGGQSGTTNDLWLLPMSPDAKPTMVTQTPSVEGSPAFSPDDRWIAYESDASSRFEVYIRSVAAGGGEVKVSRNGGWAPRWQGDGKRLFFLGLDGNMMAVDISLGKMPEATGPQILFNAGLMKTADHHTYAVTKDGKRFLISVADQPQGQVPITVALNWLALVKR
jgi:Tol biopolymer transport system component